MTQEEIKKTWREGATKLYRPTSDDYEIIYRQRKDTALETLARKYKRFSMIGLAMVFCSFAWMGAHLPFHSEEIKITITAVMAVYFAICSLIDHWLYKGVSSIDCFTMPVQEVIEKAMYYRKKHLQSIMLLLPMAICLVGLMAYGLSGDRYLLYGMAAGGLIGLLLGSMQFMDFMSEYRKIKE